MEFVRLLQSHRVLGIVRGTSGAGVIRAAIALAEEGIGVLEISLTTPGATDAISRVRRELGATAWIGAGTVMTAGDVQRVIDAGANFIVTPGLTPAVSSAKSRHLPVVGGCFTPSEIVAAVELGVEAVKLFPISLGGVGYLRALRDPFPSVPFVPVGGIDAFAARAYLEAGAVAVGVGSPLVGDAASGGSLDDLRSRVRSFLGVLRSAETQSHAVLASSEEVT
jgi:2-dehydro-3-deoxyphosphogluconate aldolase/(4S)-4-hydroxy-2-oxoglutarate aldolase